MGNANFANYRILTDPVQAVTVTEQGRTGLYIRIDDNLDWSLRNIDESRITAPPGVDTALAGEAGVPQATDLVKDMYHSYWWILNNVITHKDSRGNVTVDDKYIDYVKTVPEPVPGKPNERVEIPYIRGTYQTFMTQNRIHLHPPYLLESKEKEPSIERLAK